jgi:hypothetical protein
MIDRWNRPVVEVDRPKPTNRIVLGDRVEANGDLNSQHRVSTHPAGFRIRERGAIDGMVTHQYRCPLHGVFDRRVPRSDVPDEVACSLLSYSVGMGDMEYATMADARQAALDAGYADPDVASYQSQRCGDTAPWAGSQAGQGHSSGEVAS